MVRRFILFLMLALVAQPALADLFPHPTETKPPDVPSFINVTPRWNTDGTANSPINPLTTPPPEGLGLTEINPISNPLTTGRETSTTQQGATFTGHISGTTLTVDTAPVGTIKLNDKLYGSGVTGGESVTVDSQTSGTTGGVGVYVIHVSQATIGSAGSPVPLGTTGPSFCLAGQDVNGQTGPCAEAKFRTFINTNHILMDDPIRNYGQPGTSHCHQFFGNDHTNAYSTYATLRNKPQSTAAGYDLNGTGYWFPCPVKKAADTSFGDGHDYVVKAADILVYYREGDPTMGPGDTRIPRGLRFIFGRNMDDPDVSMEQAYLNSLNALQGGGSRYSLVHTTSGNTFPGQAEYVCSGATPSFSWSLANPDGSDPFNGTCASGADFYILVQGGTCWDGTNLWSPGGYSHVIMPVWDQTYSKVVCPSNYYRVAGLNQEIHFSQSGSTDYTKWRLSSDDMMQTKLDGLPICAADLSNAPCANGATITGSISGTTLTVSAVSVGTIAPMNLGTGTINGTGVADKISGSGITGTPIILQQLTGSGCPSACTGGVGTYSISGSSQTVASETMRASEYVSNGISMHEDWMFGWDNTTIETWEFGCIGVEGHTPHQCDNSEIDGTTSLYGGFGGQNLPDGYTMNTNYTVFPTTSSSNMFMVSGTSSGPMTMHTNTH